MANTSGSADSMCYSLEDTPHWMLIAHTVGISLIILTSFAGNGLVLLLVAKYKRLRCRSVIVSLSVVGVDLLITVSFHIPALVSTAMKQWPFNTAGCMAFGFLSFEFTTTRWLIMGVLSIDRFNTVRFPFSYKKYSKYVLITLTLLAWILPALFGTPSIIGFGDVRFRENIPVCANDCTGNTNCKLYYVFVLSLTFTVGGFLPTLLYVWLYRHARKLRPSALELGRLSVQVAGGAIVSQPVAQMERNFREIRAVVTFAIIFATVLATGMPAYVFQLLRAVNRDMWCKIPILVHFIHIEIFLSSTALDPLVIMRDRDFRRCLNDLLCCCHQREEVAEQNNSIIPTSRRQSCTNENLTVTVSNGVSHMHPSVCLQAFEEEEESTFV